MSNSPILNLDILREIVSHLPREACVSLMVTSRFFYHEAAHFVLRYPVCLRDTRQVTLFERFVYAENKSRLSYVRNLTIGPEKISKKKLKWLADNIPRMKTLTLLSLQSEDHLRKCPRLGEVVAELTTLRYIAFNDAGSFSLSVLRALRSQVEIVRLYFFKTEDTTELAKLRSPATHPVPLLAHLVPSLRKVICLRREFSYPDLPSFPQVYPLVRELYICDQYPLIAPYIHAYPALARIVIEPTHYSLDLHPTLAARFRELRALNIQSQSTGTTWKRLHHCVGKVVDVYALAPMCLITRVELDISYFSTPVARTEEFPGMISEILATARPRQLKVTDGPKVGLRLLTDPTHGLTAILQTATGSRLRDLVVDLYADADDCDVDFPTALETFAATLRMTPIRRLRLQICAEGLDPFTFEDMQRMREESPRDPPPKPLNIAEKSLKAFDVDAYTRRLVDTIPSLQDAIVGVVGLRGEDTIVAVPPRPGLKKTVVETLLGDEW